MKVRLKRHILPQHSGAKTQFQFHEGPIKTKIQCVYARFDVVFQFHEGPIKTYFDRMTDKELNSFNSMKVRLKRPSVPRRLKGRKFQFHEGPIKTCYIYVCC